MSGNKTLFKEGFTTLYTLTVIKLDHIHRPYPLYRLSLPSDTMSTVTGVLDLFSWFMTKLDDFEKKFPQFELGLKRDRAVGTDMAQWTRFARLSYLQTCFSGHYLIDSVGDEIRYERYQPATFEAVTTILGWKLDKVEDARAIDGDAERHMDALRAAILEDFEDLKAIPDNESARLRGEIADFEFMTSIPAGELDQEAAKKICRKLQREADEFAENVKEAQRRVRALGKIGLDRTSIGEFSAFLEKNKRRRTGE